MQKINKNHQSAAAKALKRWRRKHPTKTYNDLATTEQGKTLKRDIREALITEQQCLCAYCTLRVKLDSSHNEHVESKHLQPKKQLDYANLVATCKEGKGGCRCEAKKKAQRIELTPLMPECETELTFRWNGTVVGLTNRAKETISVLGLNDDYLVSRRRLGVYALLLNEGVDNVLELEDEALLQDFKEIVSDKDTGCLDDFYPVLINILDNWGM